MDRECSCCTYPAEYRFQDEDYCKDCFIDAVEDWESNNKDLVGDDTDLIVLGAVLDECDYFEEEIVERVNEKYDLGIEMIKEA